MTATSHAILGALVAAKISNPFLAIPIAFCSHILADSFPHWDACTNIREKGKGKVMIEAFIDVSLGFIISYFILAILFPSTNLSYATLIIIVSQSLDWITAPYYFFRIKTPPFTWAYKFQKKIEHKLDKPWGIINQIILVILTIILAKIF